MLLVHSPESTSTPTSRASTSTAPASRRSSATSSPASCATTASPTSSALPTWRGGLPHLPRPAALGSRGAAGDVDPPALARRADPAAAARRRRPRRARPPRRRDAAALPRHRRPRSQRPLPLVRPAPRRRGPPERPCGVRDKLAALAAEPEAPDHAARIDELAAIPSRSSASSPSGCTTRHPSGCPSTSRCSRCSSSATTASTSCTASAPSPRAGAPSPSPTTRSTTVRRTLTSTIGGVDELVPGGPSTRPCPTTCGRARPGCTPSSISTCAGRRSPSLPDAASEQLASLLQQPPFAQDVRRWPSPSAPAAGVPQLLHLPPGRRHARRGPARPRRAPHGRAPPSTCGASRPST